MDDKVQRVVAGNAESTHALYRGVNHSFVTVACMLLCSLAFTLVSTVGNAFHGNLAEQKSFQEIEMYAVEFQRAARLDTVT